MRLREDMPELTGATVWYNSEPITKTDLLGNKPTLFHFWSVSCELCKRTMPHMNEFRDKYKDDLQVIAVHMPRTEKYLDVAQVEEVAKLHDITQPIIVDNKHILTDAFKNQYVPAYYVFDIEGKLRHFQAGDGGGMKVLTKRVDGLINENKNLNK